MSSFPCLVRFVSGSGQVRYRLGERLVDRYLEFVAGRCRPNTLRAVAFDLKTFFMVVRKAPVEVTAADVFVFLADQRGDRTVVRLASLSFDLELPGDVAEATDWLFAGHQPLLTCWPARTSNRRVPANRASSGLCTGSSRQRRTSRCVTGRGWSAARPLPVP
jgi:hypothetical protein